MLAALALLVGCGGGRSTSGTQPSSSAGETAGLDSAKGDWFVDRAQAAGLDFSYFNGMSGDVLLSRDAPAAGVALFDYDNDGDLDVYFAQGQMLGSGKTVGQALFQPPGSRAAQGPALQKRSHDSVRTARGRCISPTSPNGAASTRVATAWASPRAISTMTAASTCISPTSGRIVCSGTTATARLRMCRRRAATDDPGWSVSAAFVDYDRDGWLDLYVGHYVRVQLSRSTSRCTGSDWPPRLLHASRISAAVGPALSQPKERDVRDVTADGARWGSVRSGARRRRPPTLTTTAGWIFTSPTTAAKTCCG